MSNRARVIAFYLPQFHPIPENDKWWGKGFTEWTNVGKAKPLFRGHNQPRVPTDLGYYDLRLPIVREQQAEMAREAGVEGFCYWHYWFGNGKTLLSEIFEEVLNTGKPDFPFCLGWANHSWTRRNWNSSAAYEEEMDLIEQKYPGDEDYTEHFYNVLPAFMDHRYLTIEGKPIFLLYNPVSIPDYDHFVELWNSLAIKNGLKGIYFVLHAQSVEVVKGEVYTYKGDSFTTEHFSQAQCKIKNGLFFRTMQKLRTIVPKLVPVAQFNYEDIINHWFDDHDLAGNAFPMIIPQWDRSPRSGCWANVYVGSSPDLFRKHVKDAFDIVSNRDMDHRVIFLKSWNEWAEGNYMEPDVTWGHGFLDALRDVIVKKENI